MSSAKMPSPVVFGTHEKWRINRNIFVLGFAFMVQFTAFHGAANLQSSVNTDAAAGTFTLAAIYFSLILSNVFLPALVIRWLGCKWTVAVSFIAYMPFIAAQFYPHLHTLVPAGMMVAEPYSKLSGVPAEVLVVRFFGLFFMFYQMAQIWGNLVSSAILSSSLGEVTSYVNETLVPQAEALFNYTEPTPDYGATCGVNFCSGSDAHENTNLQPPSPLKIQMIAGIYLACMVLACILVAAFVGCAYGIPNIGFVMICFGVFNALAAPIAGAVVKLTGRFPVMVTALVSFIIITLLMSVFVIFLYNYFIYQ
ncbi:unnamed protein product, partial [Leptidea sinapis]